MDSGIEGSDGLRVDDCKWKAQLILVKKNPACFTVKLEYPFLVVVENDNEYSSTSIQIGTLKYVAFETVQKVLCKFCKNAFLYASWIHACLFLFSFSFFFRFIDSSETDLEPVSTALSAPSDLSNDPWLDIHDTASKRDLPLEVNPTTSSQVNQ